MNDHAAATGGAFADGLTIVRALLAPLVMFLVIKGWPDNLNLVILSCVLFAIAALTDLFDDLTGGSETSIHRKFGWFDDIADMVLVLGTLIAMCWVIYSHGLMGWVFAVPAGIIILRDIIVGLVKGSSFRYTGWPETRLGTLKTGLSMLAICLLLASPWVTTWIDGMRATDETVMSIYDTPSPYVWWTGQAILWIAALLSLYTGYELLSGKIKPPQDD